MCILFILSDETTNFNEIKKTLREKKTQLITPIGQNRVFTMIYTKAKLRFANPCKDTTKKQLHQVK